MQDLSAQLVAEVDAIDKYAEQLTAAACAGRRDIPLLTGAKNHLIAISRHPNFLQQPPYHVQAVLAGRDLIELKLRTERYKLEGNENYLQQAMALLNKYKEKLPSVRIDPQLLHVCLPALCCMCGEMNVCEA
jgi:hypothetical protein